MIDKNGENILKDKDVDFFINGLFPGDYEVVHFYKKSSQMYNLDGASGHSITPTINIILRSYKDNELYSLMFKQEPYGFDGLYWWLYMTSSDGNKSKLKIVNPIYMDEEMIKRYIACGKLHDRKINIYTDVKITNIYDDVKDNSIQYINVALDNIDFIKADFQCVIDNLPKKLIDKCMCIFKRSGFILKSKFFSINSDKNELIFKVVKA